MKNNGVSFQIPNEYGNFLSGLLEPLPYSDYQWLIDHDEIHLVCVKELINEPLLTRDLLNGDELYRIAKDNRYYMIFVTLLASVKGETIQKYWKFEVQGIMISTNWLLSSRL